MARHSQIVPSALSAASLLLLLMIWRSLRLCSQKKIRAGTIFFCCIGGLNCYSIFNFLVVIWWETMYRIMASTIDKNTEKYRETFMYLPSIALSSKLLAI